MYNETRKGLYFLVDGKEEFTPEELTAMVLNHAEEITNAYGKEKGSNLGNIQDCVLTVPSFATQAERLALLDAAQLGDFNVLSLIDENTASALNFGMDKSYEEPQTIVFYNLGASSLQVSVIKFHSYEMKEGGKHSKKTKTVGSIEVLGKAWDSTLGGLAFDYRLVEYMADHFNREWNKARGHTKDVRDVPRAMTKLRIQANKVKHVLSANSEIPVHMDSLHDDMSLSMKINRAQFEELCEDLMGRAVAPVHDAIKSAGLTLEDITGIEMIGGGMRVPKVRDGLSKALGDKELGMHINSDESMALGAAFFGANISTAFRVRHVGLTDINPFPIAVSLEDLVEKGDKKKKNDDEEPWSKHATIFESNGKIGVKKTIAFTHDKDVHCALDYAEKETLPTGSSSELQRYKINGVAAFAKEMEEKGLGKPKVTLQFELSQSGISALVKAEATVEETYTVEEEVEIDDEGEPANANATENVERKTQETTEDGEAVADEASEKDADAGGESAADEASAKDADADEASEKDADAEAKEDNAAKDNDTKTEEEEKPKKKFKLVEKVRLTKWEPVLFAFFFF
jgi:hypoxia up-regulated 1